MAIWGAQGVQLSTDLWPSTKRNAREMNGDDGMVSSVHADAVM